MQCHGSTCTVQSRFCNDNPSPGNKTYKPSHFLDFPLKYLYVWKNTTIKVPSFITLAENETRYNATNGTYQVTVQNTYNTFTNSVVEGWETVPATTISGGGKKIHKPITALTYMNSECKELQYKYGNVLQTRNSNPEKYDLGEDNTDILDPIVNSTDYQFINASLDSNSTLTTANIVSSSNVSSGVTTTTYSNDSRLISMWELEDTSASSIIKDIRGRYDLTVYRPTNLTKGIPGYIGNAAFSNGTNNNLGGYACAPLDGIPNNPGDNAAFSVDMWVNTTSLAPQNSSALIETSHLLVSYLPLSNNGTGGILLNTITDNCQASNIYCDQVVTTTNFSSAANRNKIIHLGYAYNGTHARVYVNNVLENTSVGNFSINYALGTNNVYIFGGSTISGDCGTVTDCGVGGGIVCFPGMLDEIRWWNASITSFPINQSKYYSNIMTVSNNVTRFRVTSSSNNPSLVNTSFSLDGTTNRVENVTTGTVYNWTYAIKSLFLEFSDLLGIVDYYGTNVTFGTTRFLQNINNRNVTHNATLNISLNVTDDLSPIIPIIFSNNGTQYFTINSTTGVIAANFSITQSGIYQIRVNATINNVTAYEIFNLTIYNSPYNISSITITPAVPGPEVNMYCNIFGNDAENDQPAQGCSQYNWYRNNQLQGNHYPNMSGSYNLGDKFICEVTVCDGFLNTSSFTNSTTVVITQGGGGGGAPPPTPPPSLCGNSICDDGETTDTCQQDCPPASTDNNSQPTNIPQFNNPPIVPGDVVIQNIINNIPNNVTSHFCADTVCDPDENTQTCPRDCITNLDPYINQALFSIKCFGLKIFFFELPSYCDEESLPLVNWLLVVLAIITSYFLWIYFDKERKKNKKRKKKKRR